MRDTDLREILRRIDHRGYPAYKETKGSYDFGKYILSIDHVQGDPFAAPSKLSVKVSGQQAGFDKALYDTEWKKTALEDHILRCFARRLRDVSFSAGGSGKSGLCSVSTPGQEVLKRSAVSLDAKTGDVTVRFQVGFPARGRTVLSDELIKILFDLLPGCVERALYSKAHKPEALEAVTGIVDDQHFIREEIKRLGLCAFVADGSMLPRKSGISGLPMKDGVIFEAPESMAVTLKLPHKGELRGMGIKNGITLIVGGGYHGKSTLLDALMLGVYNHVQGDGREYVITDDTAVMLRAEDGRSIQNTDISMFINNLPNGKDTVSFSTEDASGSTSQAANTVEAIEAGARTLLIDEDTSATNFMIRDELMQQVVSRDEEPIIPFVDRVRQLYEELGISTILVAGSSGSYFYKADCVIQMKNYKPYDITEAAKATAEEYRSGNTGSEVKEAVAPLGELSQYVRILGKEPRFSDNDRIKTKTLGTDGFMINKETVELRYVEQLVDAEQLNMLSAVLIELKKNYFDGRKELIIAVDEFTKLLDSKGFAAVTGGKSSDHLAFVRKQEIYAMLNRVRECVKIKQRYMQ